MKHSYEKLYLSLVSAPSAPEPSGTPEPCPEPGVEAAPDRTRANLG